MNISPDHQDIVSHRVFGAVAGQGNSLSQADSSAKAVNPGSLRLLKPLPYFLRIS